MNEQSVLLTLLETGLANCHVSVTDHGNLLLTLLATGFVGSASHCVGMCGPFVMAQTVSRLENTPLRSMNEFSRLQGALLVPYHLGRATTYMFLGAVFGGVVGVVTAASALKALSAALLTVAALFFLGYGLKRLGLWGRAGERGKEGLVATVVGRVAKPLFDRPVGFRGYGLGVALGFLPCGLLYGALAASASAGGALAGMLGMGAFALGTIPALLGVGFAGHAAGRRWRGAMAKTAPALLIVNGGLLTLMAWRIVA